MGQLIPLRTLLVVAAGCWTGFAGPVPVHASCDAIPSATSAFRGALGSADRPFASPGDYVQLTVSTEACDRASLGIADHDGNGAIEPADFLVTLLYEPPAPGAGTRNAVILTTGDCDAIDDARAACDAALSGTAKCRQVQGRHFTVPDPSHIQFLFPSTDEFMEEKDVTLAGPITIAVTPSTEPLLCGALAKGRCAEQEQEDLVACIDELYELDGTCSTAVDRRDAVFPQFTALPVPNDYAALCGTSFAGSPCLGNPDHARLRFTTDTAGNVLVPFDYSNVLVRLDDVPVPRLVRTRTELEAFEDGRKIALPSDRLLSSFSPKGHRLPPIFTPLRDASPNGASAGALLFGSVDAARSVLRVGRLACVDGARAGEPCDSDADCSGGACEELFEFRDRYADGVAGVGVGVGPVLVNESLYTADVENPVPLDGLVETRSLFAFVRSEPLEDARINLDADATDPVVVVRSRKTGETLPIGLDPDKPGRATVRIHQPPFRYAALAAEGQIVAFLEPEPLEGDCEIPLVCDQNGDGDVFDTLLRVFEVTDEGADDVLDGKVVVVDAAPLVDGRSLSISERRVFFRVSEAFAARQRRVDVTLETLLLDDSGPRVLPPLPVDVPFALATTDRRFLVFSDGGEIRWRDRDEDGNRIYDEPEKISNRTLDIPIDISLRSLSEDGAHLSFVTELSGLDPDRPDSEKTLDCFVHDTRSSRTTRISGASHRLAEEFVRETCGLSADGRFVYFSDDSQFRLFVQDRDSDADGVLDEEAADPLLVYEGGVAPDLLPNVAPNIATSGVVAFETRGTRQIGLWVPGSRRSRLASVAPDGLPADNLSWGPRLSREGGRFVGFPSEAGNLVPGLPDCAPFPPEISCSAPLLHDRVTGLAQVVGPSGPGGDDDGQHLEVSKRGTAIASSGAFQDSPIVQYPDPDDADRDFFRDGTLDDTVLGVLDADTGDVSIGCPADEVVASGGVAAFLRPVAAGRAPGCPDPPAEAGPGDAVVHLQRSPESVESLDLVANAIAISVLSPTQGWVAALQGSASVAVGEVHVRFLDSDWVPLGIAADAIAMSGPVVAFAAREDVHGDLNGDGDSDDRVLHVFDATRDVSGENPLNLGVAVEEFVLGERILAFRVGEAAQRDQLNDDGDRSDVVMHVFDRTTGRVVNTERAASRCDLEACDPRAPYRVEAGTVRFLTLEEDQAGTSLGPGCAAAGSSAGAGCDLNGDGDADDVVVQLFDADARLESSSSARGPSLVADAAAVRALAAATAGICIESGVACFDDDGCDPSGCFVPPGSCFVEVPRVCPFCNRGETCRDGRCYQPTCPLDDPFCCGPRNPCASGSCVEAGQQIQRVIAPIAARARAGEHGALVFASAGVCGEPVGPACEPDPPDGHPTGCPTGLACLRGGSAGSPAACHRIHGTCAADAHCPTGIQCIGNLITAAAADEDGDGVPDPVDNCPRIANPGGGDIDGDGVGDACDREISGGTGLRIHAGVIRYKEKPGNDRLLLKGRFAASAGTFDPPADGTRLVLRNDDGLIAALDFPPGSTWRERRRGSRHVFTTPARTGQRTAPDATIQSLRLLLDGKRNEITFTLALKRADLPPVEAGEIATALRVGTETAVGTQPWRLKRRPVRLVTP